MTKLTRSQFTPFRTALLLALGSIALHAQQAPETQEPVVQLEKVISTGTRFTGRTVTGSAVPVDLLATEDLRRTGYNELGQSLSVLIPSLSFPRPANTDGTDSVRPASLRGLGPDQTLVLLNGKRYHSTSLVNLNGSVGRGSAAVDLNSLPSYALEGVEVLRDGAAAQYGSDAIAGVINLKLRHDLGFHLSSNLGQTYKGDGAVFETNANYGVALNDTGGFLSVTAYGKSRGKTDRAGEDLRQQYFGTNATTGALVAPGSVANVYNGTPDAREQSFNRHDSIFGDPVSHDYGVFFNASLPLQNGIEVYAFGGASQREASSFATWRRPADNNTVRAIYPNGFQPRLHPEVDDKTFVGGAKGKAGAWNWDLSQAWGRNTIEYNVLNTANVTYGAASKTEFYAGKLGFSQASTNLDLSREFDLGLHTPLKAAFGAEYRWENYSIGRGEDASWNDGGQLVLDGPNKGAKPALGAQGFPGFRPTDETDADRSNVAGYADFELSPAKGLDFGFAGRAEHYTDAGTTVTGKFSGRYELASWLAARASVSNGFRAPALQQEDFTTTSTVQLVVNGVNVPTEVKTFQVGNPAAAALGATPLKPEKSVNFSGGLTFTPFRNFASSVDYYNIAIDDRIVLSSTFSNASVASFLATKGYPGLGGGRYFTNGIDTRTEGVDFTSRYSLKLLDRDTLTLTAGYNHNQTHVTYVKATPADVLALTGGTPIFDRQNILRFERGTPRDRISLSANYDLAKRASLLVRTTRYGEVLSAGSTAALDQVLGAKWVTDVEATYRFSRKVSLSIGANNVFDVYPEKLNAANNTSGLNLYSSFSPFGFNGGFYYTRLDLSF